MAHKLVQLAGASICEGDLKVLECAVLVENQVCLRKSFCACNNRPVDWLVGQEAAVGSKRSRHLKYFLQL